MKIKTYRKFKDGEHVEFGGIIFRVRKSNLDKNRITLDEVSTSEIHPESNSFRISLHTAHTTKEGFGEFDRQGRLVVENPNRYTLEPVLKLADNRKAPWWKLLLRKLFKAEDV